MPKSECVYRLLVAVQGDDHHEGKAGKETGRESSVPGGTGLTGVPEVAESRTREVPGAGLRG